MSPEAGQPAHRANVLRRNATPFAGCRTVQPELMSEWHSAPGERHDLVQGGWFGRHASRVEKTSTPRQARAVAILSIDHRGAIERNSTAMSDPVGLKVRVGDNLQTAISAVGKTQAQIARDYNLDKTKLNHWIKGVNFPDPEFIVQFCKDHNITTDWIYRGEAWGVPGELGGYLRKAAEASAAEK